MHDELRRFGLRRMWIWTGVLVAVGTFGCTLLVTLALVNLTWPLDDTTIHGGSTTVLVGAAAGFVGSVLLVVFGHYGGARRSWPTVPLIPAPDLIPLAEGLAIARGEPTPRVWRLDSAVPNVACLPRPHGRHLIVSTAIEAGLTRDELEAVMALQFSLLLDPGASRVRRSLAAAGLMVLWALRLSLVAAVLTFHSPLWAALTFTLVVFAAILVILTIVGCQRRIRWSWGMVGDAVAIETTRHPEPLSSALRRLAGHNDGVVPVRQTWGAADPWWALTVRANIEIQTMVVNGKARTRTSTEQVSDAALLLRARIVDQVCLRHEAATVASWQEAEATFARLARASGDEAAGSVDGTVDGVTVTADGAVGTLPPVNGPWPPTFRDEAARERLRSARPIRPGAAALAAYDEAVATGLRPF